MELPSSGMDVRRDSSTSGGAASTSGSAHHLGSSHPGGQEGGLHHGHPEKKRRSDSESGGGSSDRPTGPTETMQLSLESIRGFSEILGLASHSVLAEDAAKELSEEITFRYLTSLYTQGISF